MRVHLEQEDTVEKQNYDNLKADQIDINDNAWNMAHQIVRRHYTDDDVKMAVFLFIRPSVFKNNHGSYWIATLHVGVVKTFDVTWKFFQFEVFFDGLKNSSNAPQFFTFLIEFLVLSQNHLGQSQLLQLLDQTPFLQKNAK